MDQLTLKLMCPTGLPWTQIQPTTIQRNLETVLNQSTPWEIENGKLYYPRQQQRLRDIANSWGFMCKETVGAFAALSPNNSEAMTYRALIQLIRRIRLKESNRIVAYGKNVEKATRILSDGIDPLQVLNGNKVTAFYLNTMFPSLDHILTVDGHIGRRKNS